MQVNDYIKLTGVAVGLSAGLFISYKVYKKVSAKVEENKELRDYNKEVNTSNLSLSMSDFKSMSDRIFVALNQDFNDNEATVYAVLRLLKSKDDWLMLIKAFGIKERKIWYSSNINGTLPQWFEDAFSDGELSNVREILSKIGVNF